MKRKPLLLGLVLAAVAIAAGSGYFWYRAAQVRAVVAASVPELPDLKETPFVLQERLNDADQRARRGQASALAELATVYHANGYFAPAARCYEALEALQPREPRWPHRHATILAGYGEIEPALELWRQVVSLAPDYTPARLRLADALFKSNQLAQAAAVYQEVLTRHPDEAYAALGLARIDYEQNKLESARTRLEGLVAATKAQLGYDLIVTVYERLGQNDRAEAMRASYGRASGAYRDPPDPWIDELIEECYDSYRIALVAAAAASRGDLGTGVRLLERALQISPNDLSARYQLAKLYRDSGDLGRARSGLQQCTTLSPEFSDAWILLADLFDSAGDAEGAERVALAGIGHCPDSPGLRQQHARILHKAGRDPEAMAEYEASIRLRPNEPEAYIELSSLQIQLGDTDRGVETLRRGLETDPANPLILSILAFHAITTRNQAEADKWLARVAIQPRVAKEQLDAIDAAYVKAFGRPWKR